MNENVNLFIKKLIGKAFPEFSNKVTWALITLGSSMFLLPAPTYLLFTNLLIDFYNKKTQSNISLIDINSVNPSNGIALTLILSGLAYHLFIKGFQTYESIKNANRDGIIEDRFRDSDIGIYNEFLEVLPPESLLIELLKDHDFGTSFHENSIKGFNDLRYKFGKATQIFHDDEIQNLSENLRNEFLSFDNFLAMSSHYLHQGPMLTMLTDRDRAMDMDWLPQTEEKVNKANKWSSELYKLYFEFIAACKKKLAI